MGEAEESLVDKLSTFTPLSREQASRMVEAHGELIIRRLYQCGVPWYALSAAASACKVYIQETKT